MGELFVDEALLDDITASLELREPNRDATESVIATISDFVDVQGGQGTLTAVVDAATAVGKTYTMAAIIDYLAQARGWSDFVIVTPGKIVRDKTIQNFTAGGPRSLLAGMTTPVHVITAENFDTLETASVMGDSGVAKVYVLTVQALTAPQKTVKDEKSKENISKKTREFLETFGAHFYDQLASIENLAILADEYHTYQTGKVFRAAIDELKAKVVVGLTATPVDRTAKNIIHRYPLAAAMAEGYVKLPTIVGRKDDRADEKIQLLDGLLLIEDKRARAETEFETGNLDRRINPVMLVTAKDIEDAERIENLVTSESFADGQYKGAVIRVDSSKRDSDEDWDLLESVEHPDSPVRVIVSVGMLKEGWDVKNVFVMYSTRASVSNALTEQTIGRGLRLPYGRRTGIELLDTLEVLFHAKYKQVLDHAKDLKEPFVSWKTRSRIIVNPDGRKVLERTSEKVEPPVKTQDGDLVTGTTTASTPTSTGGRPGDASTPAPDSMPGQETLDGTGGITITDMDERLETSKAQTGSSCKPITMSDQVAGEVKLPALTVKTIVEPWNLTQITDRDQFEIAGQRIASDPSQLLRRTVLDATLTQRPDGTRKVEVTTYQGKDKVTAAQERIPVEIAKKAMVDAILASDFVTSRREEFVRDFNAAQDIVDRFVTGLNGDAETLLSAYLGRSIGRILQLVTEAQSKWRPRPQFQAKVQWAKPQFSRMLDRKISTDLYSKLPIEQFKRTAFGFKKSAYSVDWFDSHPERALARLMDDDDSSVEWWLRLQNGDMPITMSNNGQQYNPDFLVKADGRMWVVEVKAANRREDVDVKAKTESAQFWKTNVNDNRTEIGEPEWGYMIAFEDDIENAHDHWNALLRLTGAN